MKKQLFLLPIFASLMLVGCNSENTGGDKPEKPDQGETTPGGGETTPGGGETTPDEKPTTLTYEEFERIVLETLSSLKESTSPYGVKGTTVLQTSNTGPVDDTTDFKVTTFDKTEGSVFIGDGMLKFDNQYTYGQHSKDLDKKGNLLKENKIDINLHETLYERLEENKGFGRYISTGTETTKYNPENPEAYETNSTLEVNDDLIMKGTSEDFDLFVQSDVSSNLFTLTDSVLNSILDFTSTDETYTFEYNVEEKGTSQIFTASYLNTTVYEQDQKTFKDKYTITLTLKDGYFATYTEFNDAIIEYTDGSRYREQRNISNELIPYETIVYPTDETNAEETTNFEDMYTYGQLYIGLVIEE